MTNDRRSSEYSQFSARPGLASPSGARQISAVYVRFGNQTLGTPLLEVVGSRVVGPAVAATVSVAAEAAQDSANVAVASVAAISVPRAARRQGNSVSDMSFLSRVLCSWQASGPQSSVRVERGGTERLRFRVQKSRRSASRSTSIREAAPRTWVARLAGVNTGQGPSGPLGSPERTNAATAPLRPCARRRADSCPPASPSSSSTPGASRLLKKNG